MIGAIFIRFSKLILSKIIKIVATRCHILNLKCTKFNFGWGCTPGPAGGAYSTSPNPLAGFMGLTSKWRRGERREGRGSPLLFCRSMPMPVGVGFVCFS